MNTHLALDRRQGRRRGRRVASGVVFNPATGEQAATVDLASVDEVDAAVAVGHAPRSRPGGRTSLSRRAEVMFRMRELVDANRKEIASLLTAEHGKVLSRRARRGRPRPREHRVRLRHPAPAEGRLLRAGGHRRRRVLDPPAARRRRRHHAVQLPGDGADVDVRQRPRVRQHVRAQAEREGPVGVAVHRRAAGRGRAAPGLLQRRARRQGGRRPAARAPRHRRRSASSARRRSPSTSTRPARANGKRVQALGGAKNHMLVLPDADLDMAADAAVSAGYGSAGERCMADQRRARVGVDRRRRSSPRSPSASRRSRSARQRAGNEMGPLITGEHRDKVRGYVDGAGRPRGHGRGRRPRRRAGRGLLPQAVAARQRRAGHAGLRRRDLRPGAQRHPRAAATRRACS